MKTGVTGDGELEKCDPCPRAGLHGLQCSFRSTRMTEKGFRDEVGKNLPTTHPKEYHLEE